MAVIEIIQDSSGKTSLHPDQREGEVHLFSGPSQKVEIGWKKYRIGSPYELDGYQWYPFFVDLDEVREAGWKSIALTPEVDQNPKTDKRLFRVWFSDSDVDCLREEMSRHLAGIELSVPMVNNDKRREIGEKYRGRILELAKEFLLQGECRN